MADNVSKLLSCDFLSDCEEEEEQGQQAVRRTSSSSSRSRQRVQDDPVIPVVQHEEGIVGPPWESRVKEIERLLDLFPMVPLSSLFPNGGLIATKSDGHFCELFTTACRVKGILSSIRCDAALWAFSITDTLPALPFVMLQHYPQSTLSSKEFLKKALFGHPELMTSWMSSPPPIRHPGCASLVASLVFGLSFERTIAEGALDDDDFLRKPVPYWYRNAPWNLSPRRSESLDDCILCLAGCFGYIECRNASDLRRSHVVPTPDVQRRLRIDDDTRGAITNCRVVPISNCLIAVSRWKADTLSQLAKDPNLLNPSMISNMIGDPVVVVNAFTRNLRAILSSSEIPTVGTCWGLGSFCLPGEASRPFVAVGDSGFNVSLWRDFLDLDEGIPKPTVFEVEQRSYSFAYVPEFGRDRLYVGCGNPVVDKSSPQCAYEGKIVTLNLARGDLSDHFFDKLAVGEARSHFGGVWGVEADASLSILFSVSSGSNVRLWDPRTHKRFAIIPVRGVPFSICYAEDKHVLMVGISDPRGFGVIEMRDPRMLGRVPQTLTGGVDFVPCPIERLPQEVREGNAKDPYLVGGYGLRELELGCPPWPEPQTYWDRASYKFCPFNGVARLRRLDPKVYVPCRRYFAEMQFHFPFLAMQTRVWEITRVNEMHFAAVCGDTVALWKLNKTGITHAKFHDPHAFANRYHGVCALKRGE